MANRRVEIDLGALRRLYVDQKLTARATAELLGCSMQTVCNRLDELGIARRLQLRADQHCIDCGAEFKGQGRVRCPACRGGNAWGPGRKAAARCAQCGDEIIRQRSLIEGRSRCFCDRECQRQWRIANPIAGSAHVQWRGGPAAKRRRIESDPRSRLRRRVSNQIWWALRTKKAGRRWESLVGYSLDDLVRHLERQFSPGMTWENYGEWHIDHIVPQSSFKFDGADDPEFRACFALQNLRPLFAKENLSKGAKRTMLI